ncbi:MAG: response regulator [Methanoregula sp.]
MQKADTISILCVDDEPLFLDAFSQRLGREDGFSIVSVSSAKEALRRIESTHFDVIVADYSMPEMDGLTLLREIRRRGYKTPFVMMTAKRLASIAIDSVNAGADYYFQKGVNPAEGFVKLVDFIRNTVSQRSTESVVPEQDRYYQSIVENVHDIICRVDPEGMFRFANEAGLSFFALSPADMPVSNFFSFIPENEQKGVLLGLQKLSAAQPDVLIEHHMAGPDGKSALLQLKYHGLFTGSVVTEYQISGRSTEGLVRIGRPEPVAEGAQVPVTPPAPASEKVQWSGLVENIQSVDTPVFAVDRNGIIIAWNRGLEELTGIPHSAMIGKGDGAYAVPFYGKAVPMLIDHIIRPSKTSGAGVKKVGDAYIGDMEHVIIKGKPLLLWGKGSPVFDANGTLIAAIEAVTIGEPPQGGPEKEEYIGGISSLSLKISGEGLGGAIAGAIGSSSGGYGVYVTNKRLIVIRDPALDVETGQGVQFRTFMVEELFGSTVDIRQKSIEDLEKLKIFEAEKYQITKIDLKKPVLLSGHLHITVGNGGSFRIYVDHKKTYGHIEQLMQSFLPEKLKIE